MQKNKTTIIHLLCLILLTISLNQPETAFAKNTSKPCPCEEEYKSEPGYGLYKQAAKNWNDRKWQKAVEKYQEIIEKHPASPLAGKAHIGTGLFLKYNGLYDDAIPEFNKGISMLRGTRSERDAETSVACIYTVQGKYDKALGLLKKVVKEARDWDEVKYACYWIKKIKRLKASKFSKLNGCGPKTLATVFRLKGIKVSKQDLGTLENLKKYRVSMHELKEAAESKGLKTTGVNIDLAALRKVEMPVIALVKPDHYIVVKSIDKDGFSIIDSARGEKSYVVSGPALQKRWTGHVLLFTDRQVNEPQYALLTKDKMKNALGGVCDCCPEGGNGGAEENKGVEGVDPPSIWVNTVNLNMYVWDTDLYYSGLGPAVEIKRSYNADDARETVFGRSWTHNYNIYLIEEPSGDVLVNRGGGKIDRYFYIGDIPTEMSDVWQLTLECTSTDCLDMGEVGSSFQPTLRVIQSGNDLTAYLEDPYIEMAGTIDSNSFTISGSYIEEDDGCIIDANVTIGGIVAGNTLNATTTITFTAQEPVDPNCTYLIGSGCQEIRATTGVRKTCETGYITYEPMIYDTLEKNPDGNWKLKIKEDKTTQHFDPNGVLTSIADKNGNSLTFAYDSNDRLITITDAAARVTTFGYDSNDRIISITDPIGRSTSYSYDANDNLITSTDLGGYITTYGYDQYSYMTSITTPKGTTTIGYRSLWEDDHAVNSIDDALGNTTTYGTYWTVGEDDVWCTDARGNTTYYDNLDYGVTGAITDPLGNITSMGYDIFGNRNSVTNAAGNTRSSVYDAHGNVVSTTGSMGDTATFTYDANDNLITTTDPLNRSSFLIYDANGNIIEEVDPLSNEVNFGFDSKGQLTSVTDAKGNTTAFSYDPNGNVVTTTDPCGLTVSYTYDGVGRLLSQTDSKGNSITFTYDGLNRITEANYPDGKITYAYDSENLISVTDKDNQVTSFEYDSINQLTRVTYPNGHSFEYDYDEVGNRTKITYPGNKMVQYDYDWANQLTRVKDWENNITLYTYDAVGNLILTQNLPFGTITSYSYDNATRLTALVTKRVDDSVICRYQYTLDVLGNRIAIEANEPLDPNIEFSDIQYAYNEDNQLLSANSNTFQYDDNGNLIQIIEDGNTTTYTYDYDNRLIQALSPDSNCLYEYDVFGNRITKTQDTNTTRYLLDINRGLPHVLAETDDGGTIGDYYIYGLGLISKIHYEPWGEPVPYYYHYDGLGSTVAITDSTGSVVNKYSYSPFGELTGIEEAISNPFRYVGQLGVMDDENGLLYMRARYYDPATGRFITKDPIGLLGGLNTYIYCQNNPIALVDPLGLKSNLRETAGKVLHAIGTGISRSKLVAYGATGVGGVLTFFPATTPAGISILSVSVPAATKLTILDASPPGGPNVFQVLGLKLQNSASESTNDYGKKNKR